MATNKFHTPFLKLFSSVKLFKALNVSFFGKTWIGNSQLPSKRYAVRNIKQPNLTEPTI